MNSNFFKKILHNRPFTAYLYWWNLRKLVNSMKISQHILPFLLAICIAVASVFSSPSRYSQESLFEGMKTVKFEQPTVAVLNFVEHSLSQSAFLPIFLYSQVYTTFDFYKEDIRRKEHFLVNPYLRNAFYVFVSINAP